MYLSFRRMPRLLRVLVWLLLLDGTIRCGRWLVATMAGEGPRLGRLGTGLVFLGGAIQLLRGRRDGLDWILLHNGAVCVLFGLAAWRGDETLRGWVLVAVVAIVAMTVYLAWCRVRLPWQARGSYGHWMSDPGYRSGVAAWFTERDRLVKQDRLEPPDPDEVVRGLLDGDDVELVRHRVQEQPQHFGMAVLRALGDPAFRRDPEMLAMLTGQLPESLHGRARDSLVACLDHLEGSERGNVLRMLAATGDAELGSLLVRELDGEQCSYVAEGLAQAITAGRVGSALRHELEPALRARLARPDAPGSVSVTLAHFDPGLPRRLIEAAASFDGEPLQGLVALGEGGAALPLDEMLTLWRRIRDAGQWYWCWRLMPFVPVPDEELRGILERMPAYFDDPSASPAQQKLAELAPRYARLCYRNALRELCARHGEAVAPLLERAIALSREDISDDAMQLLARVRGVPDDLTFSGLTALTPQQHALRVLGYAASYAGNGGLIHAFECLDAEDWPALEPALHEIAPPEVRDVWLAALRELSPTPLPADRDERLARIMDRYDDLSERLDELSKRYFACSWQLDVAMLRYAILHRDEISPRP